MFYPSGDQAQPHSPQQDERKQNPVAFPLVSLSPKRLRQSSLDRATDVSPFWFFSGLPHKSTASYLKIKYFQGTCYQRKQVAAL